MVWVMPASRSIRLTTVGSSERLFGLSSAFVSLEVETSATFIDALSAASVTATGMSIVAVEFGAIADSVGDGASSVQIT